MVVSKTNDYSYIFNCSCHSSLRLGSPKQRHCLRIHSFKQILQLCITLSFHKTTRALQRRFNNSTLGNSTSEIAMGQTKIDHASIGKHFAARFCALGLGTTSCPLMKLAVGFIDPRYLV